MSKKVIKINVENELKSDIPDCEKLIVYYCEMTLTDGWRLFIQNFIDDVNDAKQTAELTYSHSDSEEIAKHAKALNALKKVNDILQKIYEPITSAINEYDRYYIKNPLFDNHKKYDMIFNHKTGIIETKINEKYSAVNDISENETNILDGWDANEN